MPEEVKDQIIDLIGCKREDILVCKWQNWSRCSMSILEAIVEPSAMRLVGDPKAPLQALVFDSVFRFLSRYNSLFQSSKWRNQVKVKK